MRRTNNSAQEPSPRRLINHLTQQAVYASLLVSASLAIGMSGYHWVARLSWIDAFQNSAMLLGGMGPVDDIPTQGGKVFAGVFALYSGLVFLAITALVLLPVFHYTLHRFHWETDRAQ